jgi:pyridoxal phosphate enzyme (YggS family)
MTIQARVEEIRERIRRAAERSGREADSITLIAVTKGFPALAVQGAYEAGLRDFGENKAQELAAKAPLVAELPVRWHFIGHLQTNKVRQVLGIARLIHSIDSLRLADRLSQLLPPDHPLEILLQVNTSGEETKFGVSPAELRPLAEGASALPGLAVRGLMTLGPMSADPLAVRASFRLLRALSEEVRPLLPDARILSMGMSGDFEVAIEEGATHVRIGTAIFGERA